MAISDAKKVDYLWKKLGYGATKTDTNANKGCLLYTSDAADE